MKNRFLSVLLALAIIGTLSPVPVHAAAEGILDGEDVTAEMLPDSLWDHFRLYSLPQVEGTYAYRDVDSVRWFGSTLLYEYQNNYGLLDKTGNAITGLLYDSCASIGSSDLMYLPLKDGSGKHILNSKTGELYDVTVDAGGTIKDYSLSEMIVFPENGADTVVSYSGKVLKRWLTNISSYEPLAPGCIAIKNSSGLYAILNESGMTEFVYSKIGLSRQPYASNGMVYATRAAAPVLLIWKRWKRLRFAMTPVTRSRHPVLL